jgi:cystathionine beta-lyase/cystathionine gamma-synthase
MSSDPGPGPATRAVHGGHLEDRFGAVTAPVYHSSTFRFATLAAMLEAFRAGPDAMVYTRYSNPTIAALESKLAATEGAEAALAFSSGMAAITSALLSLLEPGDRILLQREVYGGTHEFLRTWAPRLGWTVDWFSVGDAAAVERGLAARPKVVYAETPTNPLLRCVDLARLAREAHAAGAVLVVDNTFATGLLQQPLALGADVVVHSATKYLGGHNDLVAGAAMGSSARMKALWKVRKIFGGCIDPQAAATLDRSIKTLSLRIERACANAATIASFLAGHALVERVHYPGLAAHPDHAVARAQMAAFGAMVTVELAGDLAAAARFVDHLRLFQLAASLGSVESLVSVPAASSHFALTPEERAAAGVSDGMVRLSVGVEDAADLVHDLEQALAHAAAGAEAARA